jgi:hypothetical protein
MFEGFVVNVLAEASKNEDVQAFVKELKDDLLHDILEAVVPLLPVFGEALVKELIKHLPIPNIPEAVNLAKGMAENILATDPDIPVLSNIFDLSELLRGFLR